MFSGGEARYLLESKPFAPGNVQISLKEVPPGRKLKGLYFELDATFVRTGAGTLIHGQQLYRLFQTITIGKRFRHSGVTLAYSDWNVAGVMISQPADIPVGAGTTLVRTVVLWIPYSDFRAESPDDADPASVFMRDTPISVDFANPAALAVNGGAGYVEGWGADPAVTGTLRVYAVHEALDEGYVPAIVETGFIQWSGQHFVWESERLLTHLALVNEDSYPILSTEVSALQFYADGVSMHNTFIRSQDLAALWNRQVAAGAALRVASATVPIAGEKITFEPPYAAAGGTTVTMEFVPIVWSTPNYKLSKGLRFGRNLVVDLQGSKTAFVFAYRAIVPRTAAQATKAAAKLGIDPASLEVKSKTGTPLTADQAWLARVLPLRGNRA